MNKTHKQRLKKFKIKQKRKTGYLGSNIAAPNGKSQEPIIRPNCINESVDRSIRLTHLADDCSLSETMCAVKNMSDNAISRLYRCTENEYRKRNIHEKTMERFKNSI